MVPKYKELLNGKLLQNEAGVAVSEDTDHAFFGILQSTITDPNKGGKTSLKFYHKILYTSFANR